MTVEVVCIDPKGVAEFWPSYRPWIDQAMRRGDLSLLDGVEDDVLAGRALLWLACLDGHDPEKCEAVFGQDHAQNKVREDVFAAAVTQIHEINERRLCVIVACGGRSQLPWRDMILAIEAFARAEACDAVRIFGRSGWSRVLRDYQVKRIMLEKELD